jgi:outer membrane receptor protein involved in Fe transport
VKHAGADALGELSELLQKLRNRPGLMERKPGIFYLRGKAFLHFHEDRAGLFADLRQDGDWLRLAVNGRGDRERLLAAVDRTLDGEKTARVARQLLPP